jgi:ribosome-binding factor A
MAEIRLKRLESLLREEISSMIVMGEIKDPRVERLTTITDITLSRDLGHAKIFVSRFGERDLLKNSVDALNHASGYIRGVLSKRVSLRTFPTLTFILDDSIERGFRIAEKLKEIASTEQAGATPRRLAEQSEANAAQDGESPPK